MMRGKERKKDQMEGKGLLLIAFTGTGMCTFPLGVVHLHREVVYRQCKAVPEEGTASDPVPVYPKASPYMPLP